MRTRNSLERLAAAGRPLLSAVEPLVDASEEEQILERILASSRSATPRPRTLASLRPSLLLGAVVIAVVVAAVAIEVAGRRPPSTTAAGHHRPVGKETTITLDGYRFRLPAGYRRSSAACEPVTSTPGRPMTVIYAVRAAASAEGGCLDVTLMAGSSLVPPDAQAVVVGPFNGFLMAQGSERETLYLGIPVADGDHYLVLAAQGLTPAQLLAVARSGLPG